MSDFAIGILGGSFDPVHNAHMKLAEAARRQCALDKLIFVPARQAALKDCPAAAPAAHRLEMLKIAASRLDFAFEIDEFELSRGGVGYSIDTALHLRGIYPNARLIWIIGSDHIGKLAQWKDIERLCSIVEFACARRPGYSLSADGAPKCARISFIDFDPLDISSTAARKAIAVKKNAESMLDIAVISYINKHKLYQ